ncbi:MAG: chromate efflux transporter [Gammaproteobacteria bacterium]|nr:chromate efflux transporter [Gammaproteobacteria bacterium]
MRKTLDVFWRFFTLGFVSFGGPAAHIGYFQKTFVQKLKWIDDEAYARLISLSQFLPGPGSSQIGFALGVRRAGVMGGFAAFIGFTLPSFLLLYFLATTSTDQHSGDLFSGIVHGLKLLAVVVVADATLSMFKTFCNNTLSTSIAALTAAILLWAPGLLTQLSVLVVAALAGANLGKPILNKSTTQQRVKVVPLALFLVLFLGLPLLAITTQTLDIFSRFYQSGSLVFGGGHVVLPLLQQTIGDSVATDRFLLGYAAAQAVPGPMFSLAAFLGAELSPSTPLLGALIATAGIFLPGFLLVLALQGAWESLAAQPKVAGAAWGINAAVVGLLLSALYQPVFVSAVYTPIDMSMVILGFIALRTVKVPIVMLVLGFGVLGLILHL